MACAIVVLTPRGLALGRLLRDAWGGPDAATVLGPSCVVGACGGPAPGGSAARADLPAGTFPTAEAGVAGWAGPLRLVLPALWGRADAIAFVAEPERAVRLIAPRIGDPRTDPAVAVVDDRGRFAVPLLGGRRAEELAGRIAAVLGGTSVPGRDDQGTQAGVGPNAGA